MPRYYRKRYTRIVRPKKRWATNLYQGQSAIQLTAAGSAASIDLVTNAAQSNVPTPIILKCGNFKLQFEYQFTSAGSGTVNGASVNAFIVYAPENTTGLGGYDSAIAYMQAHPEYILGMKTLDIGSVAGNTNVTTMSSRLKRNLNSGDKIVLVLTAKLASGSTASVQGYLNILGQYWTTTA